MKNLNLFIATFLITIPAFGCGISIPMNDIERAMAPPVSGHYLKCEDYPKEECVCMDGIDFFVASMKEEEIDKPVYSKKDHVTSCESEKACEELRGSLCHPDEGEFFFYAENVIFPGFEAYCVKISEYEKIKTGKHILFNDPMKLAAKKLEAISAEAKRVQVRDRKIQARQKIKDLNKSKLTTVASVRDLLLEVIELLKDE